MHITRRVLSRAALSNGPMQAPPGMTGAGRKLVSRVALQGYGLGLIAWGLWYKLRDPLDFEKLRVSIKYYPYKINTNLLTERENIKSIEWIFSIDTVFIIPRKILMGFLLFARTSKFWFDNVQTINEILKK